MNNFSEILLWCKFDSLVFLIAMCDARGPVANENYYKPTVVGLELERMGSPNSRCISNTIVIISRLKVCDSSLSSILRTTIRFVVSVEIAWSIQTQNISFIALVTSNCS